MDSGYYSAPPEYRGREVWVRWDSRLVRVFDARMQLIATYSRLELAGTDPQDPQAQVYLAQATQIKNSLGNPTAIGDNALQFLIVAFCIFLVIKWVNRFTRLEGDNLPKAAV